MRAALRRVWRALRGFWIGFSGMPAARLGGTCSHASADAPHAARQALAERAGRRPSCC